MIFFISSLISLAAQQELNWRFAVTGSVAGVPASDPSGTVYILTDDNTLHAIKPFSGSLIWSYRAKEPLTETLLVAGDYTVYLFTNSNRLIAVTPGGTVRWKRRFKCSLSNLPAATPDGSIIVPLKDGRLIKVNGRGEVLWEKYIPLSLTSPVVDKNGSIFISGEDSVFYCYSQTGNIKWQYKLENKVINTAIWNDTVIAVSDEGTAISFKIDGTENWVNNKLPAGIKPVSIIATTDSVKIIYHKGTIVELTHIGEIGNVFQGPPTAGFTSVDEKGALYIYGTNKKLYHYFNNDIIEIETETKMTPPLVGAAGNLISGGENWIVYCFISPSAASGWSGYRGGPLRNGAAEVEVGTRGLEKFYRDYRGFQYFKLMSESDELENRLDIFENFENLYMQGILIEKFPFAPVILMLMAEEGISRFVVNSSSLVRIKAINLLGKIGDIRTRGFLISHLYQETNSSAAISTMWALGRIGFDYDGAATRSITAVKNRFYNDDGVLLTICDTFEEIIYYNGIIPDQSGLHVLSAIYSSDAPGRIRRRAQEIFEKFTVGHNF